MTTTTTSNTALVDGWVSLPNDRGTIDILWSCVLTVFLASWTVLCLNLPSKRESRYKIFFRKLRWMLVAILGPELVLASAIGNYESARRGVRDFKRAGYIHWDIRHAIFADMGGIVVRCPPDKWCEREEFAVNNKHLLWLIKNGYVDYPEIDEREIWDRSKADAVIKFINFLQIGWLLLNTAARRAQNLTITTLELGAVANSTCSVVSLFVWRSKPADVSTPVYIDCRGSIEEIRRKAGLTDPYRKVPLDFVDNMLPSFSENIMGRVGIKSELNDIKKCLERFPNDRFPHVRGPIQYLLVVITLLAAGIHLCGWYYSFPTVGEQIAWRIASVIMFGTGVIFWLSEVAAVATRDLVAKKWYYKLTRQKVKYDEIMLKKLALPEEPVFDRETFPEKWELVFLLGVIGLYLIARVYAIIEMFIGLRRLPASAFVSVNWTMFLPHIL